MAFSDEPTALSYSQLFRYAAYLETPGYSFDACINKLRQLDGAKQQWALEHGYTITNDVTPKRQDLAPYMKVGPSGRLWCPDGGRLTLGKLSENPTWSIKSHRLP